MEMVILLLFIVLWFSVNCHNVHASENERKEIDRTIISCIGWINANTFEFTSDGIMIERWFQNASVTWLPGYVIEFVRSKPTLNLLGF